MSQVSTDIAADVSKDELVVATHGQEPIVCLANRPAAIQRWLKRLPPRRRIGMEATSIYHAQLAERAYCRWSLRLFLQSTRGCPLPG